MQIPSPDPAYTGSERSRANFLLAAKTAAGFVALIWLVPLLGWGLELERFGIRPRELIGLPGILFAPLLHADFNHLIANSLPLLVLGTMMLHVYPYAAFRVLPAVYLGPGIAAWLFGRQGVHVGASGLIYGLVSYIFVAGMIRRDRRAVAASLLVAFMYGSLAWGVLPINPSYSWETHLAAALIGIAMALAFKDRDVLPHRRYSWEHGGGEDEDDFPEEDDSAGGPVASGGITAPKEESMSSRIEGVQACVFDAYGTLFDFASAASRCSDVLGDRATALTALWRDKQLQYTWLRGLQGRHADFWQVTVDALDYAMETLHIDDAALKTRLMDFYLTLDPFPEVAETLRTLKNHGFATAILSNGTPQMLASAVKNAQLGDLIDAVISVEEVGVYKPHPSVYQRAVDRLGVAADRICFQSSNAWDAYAASAFGMRVVWCNRYGQRAERLPGRPDAVIRSLAELPPLLL